MEGVSTSFNAKNHINISRVETLATIQCPTKTINTHNLTLPIFQNKKNTAPWTSSSTIDMESN